MFGRKKRSSDDAKITVWPNGRWTAEIFCGDDWCWTRWESRGVEETPSAALRAAKRAVKAYRAQDFDHTVNESGRTVVWV